MDAVWSDEFYGTNGEHGYGYGQDEDQGQLGSLYVMAAMGLFDVSGWFVNGRLSMGSPLFDKIEIKLSPVNEKRQDWNDGYTDAYYVQWQAIGTVLLYWDELYKGGRRWNSQCGKSTEWEMGE